MSDFHLTRGGRAFYERDVPELLRLLAQLNETLARIAAALETREARPSTEERP